MVMSINTSPIIPRQIIHIDMDAFYASVEILDNPKLQGKPVIVGGATKRGVVSAASYEARQFGVHSAMAGITAARKCPHAIFLPVRLARYQEISAQIMAIFARFTPAIEQISVDEAFLDVTACQRLIGPAHEIAETIRQTIHSEIGITASAGIASSKLVAKIASDQNKPDGLTIVPLGKEAEFLAPLPIKRLWGIGKKTIPSLHLLGIKKIGDIVQFPLDFMEKKYGKQGRHMYYCARGIDNRDIEKRKTAKSIGNEETFKDDIINLNQLKNELLFLATKVGERLRNKNLQAQTITLKIKYHDFTTVSRSTTLKQASSDSKNIYQQAISLLPKTKAGEKAIRLVGISTGNLVASSRPKQLALFAPANQDGHQKELTKAIDTINKRYGFMTIKPAPLTKR